MLGQIVRLYSLQIHPVDWSLSLVLSHRMKIINDLKNSNPCPSINDLYSTVLPGKNPLLRSHLSKTGALLPYVPNPVRCWPLYLSYYCRTRKASVETSRKGKDPRRKSKDSRGPGWWTESKGSGESEGEKGEGKGDTAAKSEGGKEKLTSCWRTNHYRWSF